MRLRAAMAVGCLLLVSIPLQGAGSSPLIGGSGGGAHPRHERGLLGRLPIRFERNLGQADPAVAFVARTLGATWLLTSTGAMVDAPRASTLRMTFEHARSGASIRGVDRLPGFTNYFTGPDPARWRTRVPSYGSVRYRGVYPGIDVVFHASARGTVEYDFVVGAGADPGRIS